MYVMSVQLHLMEMEAAVEFQERDTELASVGQHQVHH
jgi:hypothetical protein